MSIDPMGTVVEWLDAYGSGDLEAILRQNADHASIECGRGGGTVVIGRSALRAYWEQRLRDHPASALDDVQLAQDGAFITYLCNGTPERTTFEFDHFGQIIFQNCGPLN